MTCSVCGDRLNGTYFTFLDKLICEKDYKVTTTKNYMIIRLYTTPCRPCRRPAVTVAA